MSSYKVITVPDLKQGPSDLSFKGGVPSIPHQAEIPNCKLCKSPMTFFFQIAFPKDHIWEDKVMVFFHCTSCYDVDNYWPKTYYTRGQEHYPLIPDGFLDSYQTNFSISIFDRNEPVSLRENVSVILQYEKLEFEKINPKQKYKGITKVGGVPAWDANKDDGADEIYKELKYMGGGFDFLMQTERDWPFIRLPEAPFQFEHYKQYGDNQSCPFINLLWDRKCIS